MQQNEYQKSAQTVIDRRILNSDPREISYETVAQPQPRRRSTWRAPLLCLLALAVTLGILELTGGFSLISLQKSLPTRAFTINGHGTLVINDNSGTFHIHEGTTNQLIVQGSEHAFGLTSNFTNTQVQYKQQGNTVTLDASEGWNILGSSTIDFTITIPANLDVTIHGGSTDVDMTRIDGQVNANIGSGNLHLNNVNGPLNLNTGSGDITISDEQGSVNAHTGSGNIQINQLIGPVNLSTDSGDITLEQAHISGQDQLQTSSGNIHFSGVLDARGNYQMNTSSGNITLSLPASSSFQLAATTDSGTIHNAFNTSTGNAPHPTLTLKTSSGDIDVQKQ